MYRPHLPLTRRQFAISSLVAALGGGSRITEAQHSPFAPVPSTDEESIAPLLDLLALVPRRVSNPVGGQGWLWEYANVTAQFAAVGVEHSIAGLDPADQVALDATYSLTAGLWTRSAIVQAGCIESLGFDPYGMSQSLFAGESFGQLTLFRGGFDPELLTSTWESAGYERVRTITGQTVWTIGPTGELWAENPVQRSLGSSMNNAAIIDDRLVFAPLQETLEMVFAIGNAPIETAFDDPATLHLLDTLPGSTSSAIALRPDAIDYPAHTTEMVDAIEAQLAPVRDEYGPMHELQGLISAVNAGAMPVREDSVATDAGAACFRIQYENNAAATQAATVFAQRWQKLESPTVGERYEALMSLDTVAVDGGVVSVDLTQLEFPGLWNELFRNHDVLPLLPDR